MRPTTCCPGKCILEGLEEEVADHALCLGHQGIEGVRMGKVRIASALKGQQAHLRAIAVRDDEVMVKGERGERFDRRDHVLLLHFGERSLSSLQERIPTQGRRRLSFGPRIRIGQALPP
jgi:hypothetical protein